MVINLEQKKSHFDCRFILTYNIYTCMMAFGNIKWELSKQNFGGIVSLLNSFTRNFTGLHFESKAWC